MHMLGEDSHARVGKSRDVREIQEEMLVWPERFDIGYYSGKKGNGARRECYFICHLLCARHFAI